MRISHPFKTVWLLAFLTFSMPVKSATTQWQLLQKESQLTFTGTQNDAPVTGEFKTFNGTIVFDPDQLNTSHIDIVVDMNSLTLSYAEAKDALKTANWFHVTAFPKAEFKASQWEKMSDNRFKAQGMLTIRDKTMPTTLEFTLEKIAANKEQAIGHATIKRTAFGVGQGEWAKTTEVKDDVTIYFKVTAITKK